MNSKQDGVWVDEATRSEIVALLKEARRNIAMRPDHGGPHGAIGRIDFVLAKLTRAE